MIWLPIFVCAVMGLAVLGLWTMLVSRHAVPELTAGKPSIRFHIAAEALAAVGLLVGAVLLATNDGSAARVIAGASLGAILYSTINSPGYYADRGERAMVVAFGAMAVAVVAALVVLLTA